MVYLKEKWPMLLVSLLEIVIGIVLLVQPVNFTNLAIIISGILLYQLTGEKYYLTCAEKAAYYFTSWMYHYDPVYGARPLKRYMQHTLETNLAKSILAGGYVAGDTITVDYDTAFTIRKA